MRLFKVILLAISLPCVTSISAQKVTSSFGKGINLMADDSSMSFKFNLRMQNLLESNYNITNDNLSSNFMIRRARIHFNGFAFSPKLIYKVELGLSSRDMNVAREDGNTGGSSRIILDMVAKYQFHKNWQLWAGQTKLPGNRERVVSSRKQQFVDRSLVNANFNIDRDVGLQLHGNIKFGENIFIQPKFAISQGEGRSISSGNFGGLCYTGRLDILPLGLFEGSRQDYSFADINQKQSKPKFSIGLTYNYNHRTVRQQGQLGDFVYNFVLADYQENTLQMLQADLLFKHQGFSIYTDITNTTAENYYDFLNSNFRTGTGFNYQMGYVLKNNLEFSGRFTTITPDSKVYSGIRETDEYTFCISKYFVGHNLKIQTDFSWFTFNKIEEEIRFRTVFDVQF